VQGLLSLQVPLVFEYLQPVTLSHVSDVQAFLSSHDRMLPRHEPEASQTSLLVQALPSSHPNETLGLKTQEPTLLQLSCVHGLLSLHDSLPGLQDFCEQVSPTVQALPSSHEMPSADEYTHPAIASHESVVHGFPSLQSIVEVLRHPPTFSMQVSLFVHLLPSSQDCPLSAANLNSQAPLAWLHELLVHESLSLHTFFGPDMQAPPLQASPSVQAFPSLQP